MQTIVIDTNILIASLFNQSSASANIVAAVQADKLKNAWTTNIRKEATLIVGRVQKPLHMSDRDVENFLNTIFKKTEKITNPPDVHVIEDDPDDDKFLACAIASEANAIVSNDEHLLNLGQYEGIEIMTSGAYKRRYLKQKRAAG
jgi:hypothetical protein